MRKDLEDSLRQKYPQIIGENIYFDCGDGWFNIVDCLCANIQSHVDHKRRSLTEISDEEFNEEHCTRAAQIKEKFGGLRFYVDNGDPFTDGVISLAETISMRTCESCGNQGSRRGKGWLRVRCDSCDEKEK